MLGLYKRTLLQQLLRLLCLIIKQSIARSNRKSPVLSPESENQATAATNKSKTKRKKEKDYKAKFDFNGIDLKANPASMFTKICHGHFIALGFFSNEFGFKVVSEPVKPFYLFTCLVTTQ